MENQKLTDREKTNQVKETNRDRRTGIETNNDRTDRQTETQTHRHTKLYHQEMLV